MVGGMSKRVGEAVSNITIEGEPIDLPEGETATPLMWAFRHKYDINGKLESLKARICVRGDLQAPTGNPTFTPVSSGETIRGVVALAACEDLAIYQADYETAFSSTLRERKRTFAR